MSFSHIKSKADESGWLPARHRSFAGDFPRKNEKKLVLATQGAQNPTFSSTSPEEPCGNRSQAKAGNIVGKKMTATVSPESGALSVASAWRNHLRAANSSHCARSSHNQEPRFCDVIRARRKTPVRRRSQPQAPNPVCAFAPCHFFAPRPRASSPSCPFESQEANTAPLV